MNEVLTLERFVFPGETSTLTDAEYRVACNCLDWITAVISLRARLHRERGTAFEVHIPAGNWDKTKAQTFELDSAATNPFTSFNLLMTRDRDVVRQLRLYSQAFTGYQLATMEMANRRPWIRKPLPKNLDEIVALLAHTTDPNINRWARIARAVPPRLVTAPPPKFGEMGWLVSGRIVNYDTWCYLQRLALLHESGLLAALERIASSGRRPRIMEIGGGYGALAHHLLELVPTAEITIVDLPESLAFSTVYLSGVRPDTPMDTLLSKDAVRPDAAIHFCPNFLLSDFLEVMPSFDLVINTCSLNEMTEAQVGYYAAAITKVIGTDGVFFEQNDHGDRHGVMGLSRLLAPHFKGFRECPATMAGGELNPGPARLWSNV